MRGSHSKSLGRFGRALFRSALLCSVVAPLGLGQAAAQDAADEGEIVVTGIRAAIQSSIEQKREAAVVSDVLSADDIGDLPALSIGEAIETITGASTHREKGGASEISIRGLGPFLGYATFNGREATNGSGDRSVNFNQFPSELINAVAIYKTQQADFVEGGVAGIIDMQTVQPIDFGRRRLQIDTRATYADYDSRLNNDDGIGWRGTVSYIDQFDLGRMGEFGVSFGIQSLQGTNPEELFTSSSTWVACNANQVVSATANCAPVSRADAASGTPFYLIPGSRTYRQIAERDQRDAVFAAFQWQPNPAWEIALDVQSSQRVYTEDRSDLNFSETLRGVNNRVVSPNGTLLYYEGNSSIESTSTFRIRDEQYDGAGLNVRWDATDRLTLSADLSYSHTWRSEMDRQTRLRTDNLDIFGVPTPVNNQRVGYTFDYTNSDIPAITVNPLFDLNNHALYSDDARMRRDELVREDDIIALRFDGEYRLGETGITALQFGVRFSERTYTDFDDRVEFVQNTRTIDRDINLACRRAFPQSNFLSNANGNTITSWATFDPLCLFQGYNLAVFGNDSADTGRNADTRAIGNRDVEEQVNAIYAMGVFNTAFANVPVSGNFGVRVVNTNVTSIGLRSDLDVITNPDTSITLVETGNFETLTIEHDSTVVLPSLNATFELSDDLLLRAGLFRAMSRPDPSALGAGRTITLESGLSFPTIEDAINSITANGNPRTEPLMSWNADVSLEYYANADSIVSLAAYYKVFEGGFVPVAIDETFVIDGNNVVVPVLQDSTTDETSTLWGLEITAAHRFSYLPGPLEGLGFKLSYNYSQSDFETEDLRLGDLLDPTTGLVEEGMIPPAGIFGLSEHVFSGSLYYEIGPIELQAIYKFRSDYYQKFVGAPSQNRYIRDTGVLDFRAGWRVNDMLSLTFEGSNLNDEERIHDMPVSGSLREYNTYGPRYYMGARLRF
jgi:iron complex outermembrane receptor protein